MAKKSEDTWEVQMHVLVDQVADPSDLEHDYDYAVEYNPSNGSRRTVKLTAEEVEAIRAHNGFPAEEIVSAEEE
jgi:hypothetical protein